MPPICRICERMLSDHSHTELAACLMEDERQKILQRIACDASWERRKMEARLVKVVAQ